MARWIRACDVSACGTGQAIEVVIDDRIVALFNVDGAFYALDGICPHQGGPLGCGELAGMVVTCPWHGWQFDVVTGANRLSPRIVQPRFPTRVDDGAVWVDVEA